MGFKFKRIDLTAGSSEFPIGSTTALQRTRCEAVLKALADALLAMNIGWQLDSSRGDSDTTSDFANVPARVGSNTFPGLFFKNTVSGCKLFMAYFLDPSDYNSIKDFGRTSEPYCVDLFGYAGGYMAGVVASIIPEGSTNEFGMTFDTSFIPSDATRIMGTAYYYQSISNIGAAYNPTSGYIYSWGIYANERTVAFSAANGSGSAPDLGVPVYATGRLFGTLAHSSDTALNAKYASIAFRVGNTTNLEGTQNPTKRSVSKIFGLSETVYFPGFDPTANTQLYELTGAVVSKSDGSWANPDNADDINVPFFVSEFAQLGGYVFNSTGNGKSRWIPLCVTVAAANLTTYGIVPGDGFKGYLDTDLFRCAKGTYGQMFDNGNFICPQNDLNLLIGWDSTNTDSIAG